MLHLTSRWLKRIISILLILFLCYVSAFVAFYQATDFATLQQRSQHLFQNHRVTFNTDIERRLFPRPTIILHDVNLYKNQEQKPLFNAKEIHIGIAWQSLWQKNTIEKLVITELSGSIYRKNETTWNISDLLLNTSTPHIFINRIYLHHALLTLHVDNTSDPIVFKDINLNARRQQLDFVFETDMQPQHPLWETLYITANGEASWFNQQLNLPVFNAQFRGTEQGHPFSGSLKNGVLITTNHFVAHHNVFTLNSERFHTNISTSIDNINNKNKRLNFKGINSNYDLNNNQRHYTGVATALHATLLNQTISSENLSLSFNYDDAHHNKFNIAFHGSGLWRNEEGLLLPDVEINSQQITPNNKIRFAINGKGKLQLFHLNHWQLQANGSFDKQPVDLKLQRQNHLISGDVVLDKLDLSNYLPEQDDTINQYPAWPERDLNVQLNLNVGTLKLPSLEINNIDTTMYANAQQTEFNPFSAQLYGGNSTGYLRIENQTPLKINIRQNSQNVAIAPLMNDLFNFSYLSGTGQLNFEFNTQGNTRQKILQTLSGSLKVDINQGQWKGINFAQLFKATFGNETSPPNTDTPHTPFKQLQMTSQIKNGISNNHIEANIMEPIAHLISKGQTQLDTGEIHNDIMIHSQNNVSLPIKLSGNIEHPNITLNYKKLTEENASTQDKQKAISDTLKQQWQWLQQ